MKFIHSQLRVRSIIPWIETENDFHFIRSYLLDRPTVPELQMVSRIMRAADDPPTSHTVNASLVPLKQKQKFKSTVNLIIHYTHEKRFHTFKKDIHQLWDAVFGCTPVSNTKLIIGHRNNKSTTQELVQRRPHSLPKLLESAQQANSINS